MAKMIPELLLNAKSSNAEIKVFNYFKNATDTVDWIVISNMRLSQHNSQLEGEVDFIVLVPDLGIFVLEVKGGRICCEDAKWYSIDIYNQRHNIKNPFKQADDNAASIRKFLKYSNNPLCTYGVMFPDCRFDIVNQINECQWRIFDNRDGTDVVSYIKKLGGKFRQLWRDKKDKREDKLYIPNKTDLSKIKELLIPKCGNIQIPLQVLINEIKKSQERLTEEQNRYIQFFYQSANRCLIDGAAGTGKTILTIETAKLSLRNKEKTAVFCYNTILGNWLKTQLTEYNPQYVGTFHDFMLAHIQKAGIPLIIPDSDTNYFDAIERIPTNLPIKYPKELVGKHEFWEETVPLCMLQALEKLPVVPFERIIIDEAQDLLIDNYIEVLKEILKNGIYQGKWCFFGDFSNQVSQNRRTGDEIKQLIGNPKETYFDFHLVKNCRNTKEIGQTVQNTTGVFSSNDYLKDVEQGEKTIFRQYSKENRDEYLEKLHKELTRVTKTENINKKTITILSALSTRDLNWWGKSILSELSQKITINEFTPNPNNLTYSTVGSFKGMEQDVIILIDVETYKANMNTIYIGMTRARSYLIVFESEEAKKERLNLQEKR